MNPTTTAIMAKVLRDTNQKDTMETPKVGTRRIVCTNHTANTHDHIVQVYTIDGWWNFTIDRIANHKDVG